VVQTAPHFCTGLPGCRHSGAPPWGKGEGVCGELGLGTGQRGERKEYLELRRFQKGRDHPCSLSTRCSSCKIM
jgi:hypothetical protein